MLFRSPETGSDAENANAGEETDAAGASTEDWVVDSGASFHVTPHKRFFRTYVEGDFGEAKMGNSGVSKIIGMGDIHLESEPGCTIILKKVRHIPDFRMSLISSGKLDDEEYYSLFGNGQWKLTKNSLVVARGVKEGALYRVRLSMCKGEVNAVETSLELWYNRLGHMSEKGLKILSKKKDLPGFEDAHLRGCTHHGNDGNHEVVHGIGNMDDIRHGDMDDVGHDHDNIDDIGHGDEHDVEQQKIKGKEHMVCKLEKSLYSLKQAPRQWYKKFGVFVVKHGCKRSMTDRCVFVNEFTDGDSIVLLLSVDDVLIVGKNINKIAGLKRDLGKAFEMKDLGKAKHILGMEIKRDRAQGKLWLSQEKYVEKVLKRFNMDLAKLASCPLGALCC